MADQESRSAIGGPQLDRVDHVRPSDAEQKRNQVLLVPGPHFCHKKF
jgi:hypothetical protein